MVLVRFPPLTPEDSLSLYRTLTAEQMEKVKHVIDFIGVRDIVSKEIGAMSGGEGRKCLIGRALVCDPQAMLLDEPTTGLDLRAQGDFLELMEQLSSEKTMILVTHHIEEIIPSIKTVAVLSNGHIQQVGKKEDMLTSESISKIFQANISVIRDGEYYRIGKNRTFT